MFYEILEYTEKGHLMITMMCESIEYYATKKRKYNISKLIFC